MRAALILLAVALCLAGSPANRFQDDPKDKRVTIVLDGVDVRDAIRMLCTQVGASYQIAPEVQGTVNMNFRNVPFEAALRGVLSQAAATFRVDSGIYSFIPREPGEAAPTEQVSELPEFRPGAFSASCIVKNKALYLSPNRTFGGTYALLAKAVAKAGLGRPQVYRYGNDGLALVLPLEALLPTGKPLSGPSRFAASIDLSALDFRKIGGALMPVRHAPSRYLRVLVLLVTSEPVLAQGSKNLGVLRSSTTASPLSASVGKMKWEKEPKLTALVYEFRRKEGNAYPVLLKAGESGVTAKSHLIASCLWTASALR